VGIKATRLKSGFKNTKCRILWSIIDRTLNPKIDRIQQPTHLLLNPSQSKSLEKFPSLVSGGKNNQSVKIFCTTPSHLLMIFRNKNTMETRPHPSGVERGREKLRNILVTIPTIRLVSLAILKKTFIIIRV
jgi:hypothetical protein